MSSFLPTFYALVPMAFALCGGLTGMIYRPKPPLLSFLQHLVAGVVIGAVTIEFIPKLANRFSTALGFILGIVLMFALHELAHLLAHKEGKTPLSLRLVGGSAIDLFVDGILIGLAFIGGLTTGLLITLSLTPCAFLLNLSVATTLQKRKTPKSFILFFICLIAIVLPLGALVGQQLITNSSSYNEILAASSAALLYLDIEEFVIEAHETPQNRFLCLGFFLGFLIVLMFKI